MGVHYSTVSRTVRSVSILIIRRLKRIYLTNPVAQAEIHALSNSFQRKCHFPGVIGAVDCTHIRIASPNVANRANFINRKNYYSLNCQMICDTDLKFWNVVVRWPGSTHDSRIFSNSDIGNKLENGQIRGILLGDSGYACKPYMMTPILRPANIHDRRFNSAQRSTRNVIERAFGVLKRRFSVLGPDSRMRNSLDTNMAIIVACTILHNICMLTREVNNFPNPPVRNLQNFNQGIPINPNNRGNAVRQALVHRYF
ncbi:UNVERIFIED_CONTAM: hypothetical protein GTU68_043350 [Idotea baltica]|nr:hypothetical protein [Idotea baltica]